MKKIMKTLKTALGIISNEEQFDNGYKWAVDQLHNPANYNYIKALTYKNCEPFDRGAQKALNDFSEKTLKEHNS